MLYFIDFKINLLRFQSRVRLMLLGLNFGFNDNPATVNANKYIIQIEILAQLLNGA